MGCHSWLAGGGVGFDRDDADFAFGEEFQGHVEATFGPFIALLGHHCANKADSGRSTGRIPTTSRSTTFVSIRIILRRRSRTWALLANCYPVS